MNKIYQIIQHKIWKTLDDIILNTIIKLQLIIYFINYIIKIHIKNDIFKKEF